MSKIWKESSPLINNQENNFFEKIFPELEYIHQMQASALQIFKQIILNVPKKKLQVALDMILNNKVKTVS